MDYGSSYDRCVDNTHYPTILETLFGPPVHGVEYGNGHCPIMPTMNVESPASPPTAPNTGPFVTMHIDHYLSLMRRLEVPLEPNDQVTRQVSGPATTSVGEAEVVQTIHIPPRHVEARDGALGLTLGTVGGQPHGKRSKVACTSCSNAHKTCDQGRPCRRCTKRGIGASCAYPATKGGRRARKTTIVPPNGECCAGMSSMNDPPERRFTILPGFENPSEGLTAPRTPDMFQNYVVGSSYAGNRV